MRFATLKKSNMVVNCLTKYNLKRPNPILNFKAHLNVCNVLTTEKVIRIGSSRFSPKLRLWLWRSRSFWFDDCQYCTGFNWIKSKLNTEHLPGYFTSIRPWRKQTILPHNWSPTCNLAMVFICQRWLLCRGTQSNGVCRWRVVLFHWRESTIWSNYRHYRWLRANDEPPTGTCILKVTILFLIHLLLAIKLDLEKLSKTTFFTY